MNESTTVQQARSTWQEAQSEYSQGHLLKTFRLFQQSLRCMDLVSNPSLSFLQENYRMQSEMLSLADTLLDQYGNAASRLLLLRFLMPLFEKTMATAYTLYAQHAEEAYLDKAFLLAEQSRNLMLTEGIRNAGLKAFRDVPPAVIKQQQEWSAAIFIYRNRLDAESAKALPNKGLMTRYSDSLQYFQHLADSMNYHFSTQYPSWYQLMHRQHFATPRDVQDKLSGSRKVALEYFCGENAVYLFCITPANKSFYRIVRDSSFGQQLAQFQSAILKLDAKAFAAPACSLYETLVKPAKNSIDSCDQIVVIHHGFTGSIPFEALLCTPPKPNDGYQQFDYAIRHACYSYAPSATLWLGMKSPPISDDLVAVGFAPVFSEPMKNSYRQHCGRNCDTTYLTLPEQRWSLRFAEEITGVIPGRWFTGEAATVSSFLQNAGDAGLIHLATHTFFDAENPMNSRVILAKDVSDTSSGNGIIRASDLYNMQLKASLAILGSCGTGSGIQSKGEGIISLAYAFSYAGCNSLVYSLWSVDEKMTSQLMRNFYEGLRDGLPKDMALHQAKLNMLAQSNDLTANPLYWAGFVFSGDAAPLVVKPHSDLRCVSWMAGGVALTALLLFLFLKNKRRIIHMKS